jgi:hypothetical protein
VQGLSSELRFRLKLSWTKSRRTRASTRVEWRRWTVRKTPFWGAMFSVCKKRPFYQDRLGTNTLGVGKTEMIEGGFIVCRLHQLDVLCAGAARLDVHRCEKRHFLRCHLYTKCIILPRQARDKQLANMGKVETEWRFSHPMFVPSLSWYIDYDHF